MNKSSFLFLAFLAIAACSPLKITDNSVLLKPLDGSEKVRVEAVADGIFRVSSTLNDKFPDPKSLIVLEQPLYEGASIERDSCEVRINTPKATAHLLISSGRVYFTDASGQLVLNESSRELTPYKDGISFSETFDSPSDEAFFGLGQHQSEEWNYKGKDEELYQYNTKVSVPFVYSTKGYGLLVDSYSYIKWGNPEPYENLGDVFGILDSKMQSGALTGTYTPAQGEILVRRESEISFENLDRSDSLKTVVRLPKDFKYYGSNILYEGFLLPGKSAEYDFSLYYAGYMKVFIAGKEVVPERWRTAWNPNTYKFSVRLEKDVLTPIRIEWKPDGDVSYCALRVKKPSDDGSQRWWSELSRQMDWYYIAGASADEVISGYRTLTGKSQIMPRWAMGFWQSRDRYMNAEELTGTVDEFRRRALPLDNIVQDWNYWEDDQWGSHEFDPARYPDPKATIDSLHSKGAHLMISVWPKFYVNTEHYKEFNDRGWMYNLAYEDKIKDWLGYYYAFYDAYSPEARKLFWLQMDEHLFSRGVDAWWMDASEPNIRDCTDMQYRKDLCGPTAMGSSEEYFNTYSIMNAEAIYDGQRTTAPDQRVFLLTRSGFAGLQRYSTAVWSGDIGSRWEDMRSQITAGANFSICGIPYWTMDIGGYCVEDRYSAAFDKFRASGRTSADLEEWRELNARWHQFGAFCPIFRSHGKYPYREAWNVAPENHPAYESIEYYDRLRYRLMPYIYSLAGATWFEDYTIMRPLVMDFGSDLEAVNTGSEYMFGPSILVCPVTEYKARSRKVYLPEWAQWYDFYSCKLISEGGENLNAPAPYGRLPLYIKAGSIIPETSFGQWIQTASEALEVPLAIHVYEGADGHFTLYEDDGTSYGYERGECSFIDFGWDDNSKSLTISKRRGSFPSMQRERTFDIAIHHKDGTMTLQKLEYQGLELCCSDNR